MSRVPRRWLLLLALCGLSSASLIAVGIVYSPLQVDGGWASYGGFAISQDREPYLHQATLEETTGVPGLKALFLFDTVSNTRALYTSLWFRMAGPSWLTVKALGLIELIAVIAIAWAFFSRLLPSREAKLVAIALLATDKMVVLVAATDFRPDVAQAGLGCLFYLLLARERWNVLATIGLGAFAALAGAFSATAVTPVAAACLFRTAEVLTVEGTDRNPHLARVVFAVLVAASAYLMRQEIFPLLLGAGREVIEPVSAGSRIAETWEGGVPALIEKESFRWGGYFLGSNVTLLAALALAAGTWVLPKAVNATPLRSPAAIWLGAFVPLGILVLLDPHPRPQHLLPVMPFLLLLLAPMDQLAPKARRLVVGGLSFLIISSSLLGFQRAFATAREARSAGFSNAWLASTLRGLTLDGGSTIIVGGAEFWPYWDPSTDVTIVDVARSENAIQNLGPLLDRADYAVLSADYHPDEWLARVQNTYGVDLDVMLDKRPYLVIAEGFPQR